MKAILLSSAFTSLLFFESGYARNAGLRPMLLCYAGGREPAGEETYSAGDAWTLRWSCSISLGSAGATWANLAKP
jgi:hypothetical protein